MKVSRASPRPALTIVAVLIAPALAGCLSGGDCSYLGASLVLAASNETRILPVDVGRHTTLMEAFNESSFVLSVGFPEVGLLATYLLEFNATGPNGTGLYAVDPYAWRGYQPLMDAAPGTHPFVVRVDVDTADPVVRGWVFFGGDNEVEGAFSISEDRWGCLVASADFEVPHRHEGFFRIPGGIHVFVSCWGVCAP